MILFHTVSLSNIARSNEILGWGGVGNRQLLLCFLKFKAVINWSMLTANQSKKSFFFSFFFFAMFYIKNRIT
jgi:hypothetical protein